MKPSRASLSVVRHHPADGAGPPGDWVPAAVARQTVVNALASCPEIPTLAHLLDRLGGVPPQRVRYCPLPGTANVNDVLEILRQEQRLCELVDGVLVEKALGFRESIIAVAIASVLQSFVSARQLGMAGTDGMISLLPGIVRIPDVAYISAARLAGSNADSNPVPVLSPNVVAEVLSAGNTPREMDRKREEYFRAGLELLWIVDPDARVVDVYTHRQIALRLHEDQCLAGDSVLPGFSVRVGELFAEVDAMGDSEQDDGLS